MTCTQELTALLNARQWWHLLYIFVGVFLWSLAVKIADEVASRLWRKSAIK